MAKHIRNTHEVAGNGYWETWNKFMEDKGLNPEDYNYQAIQDRATKQSELDGRDIEEVKQEMWDSYTEIQAEYNLVESARRAITDQSNLMRNNLLDSFCSVFQKADRILSNLSVDVFLNDVVEQNSPAWNDGKNVTFNSSMISELNEDTVTSLHGLNYHELSHLLFTPRAGTALGKWVMERKTIIHENKYEYNGVTHTQTSETVELVDSKRAQAFNILEDCRAEYYMTLKYPSTRPFFVALLGEYIAKHQSDFADNFILLAGRKYFSLQGRQYSALAYAEKYGMEQAKQVYSICAEYRTLVYPRDYTRGQELIEQLMAILPEELKGHGGCGGRPVMRNGKPVGEKEQSMLGDSDNEPDKLGGNGGLSYSSTGKKNDNGKFDKNTKDFNTKKETEVMESIEQAVQRAKSDGSLKSKVRETIKAINKDSSTKSILGRANGTADEPTQAEIMASRMFGQELERIRIECDPAWELERPTGKLNVRRAMNADVNEIGKLFDRWTMGNEDYDIECCIALDRSGSMYSEIGSASRSAWVIKRAIEKINGRVSVMTFNHESRMLYTADQKASATSATITHASGGTDPRYAILESQRIFAQSKAKTKLLFLLTDGGFAKDSDFAIESMNRDGVFTSVIFLSSEDYAKSVMANPEMIASYSHGAKNFRAIGKPSDLVKVAKDVVKHTIKAGR